MMPASDAQPAPVRIPTWMRMIILLPVLVILGFSVVIYVNGHRQATRLGASLVTIDATVISVEEEVCGGRARHACYRIRLQGLLDGVARTYQTYDGPRGRFSYTRSPDGTLSVVARDMRQTILVPPSRKGPSSKMYWNRDDPVEDFQARSTIMLVLIAFDVLIVPLGFWFGRQ